MQCPICKQSNHAVKRTEAYDTVIIRKRKCKECGYMFPTFERIEEDLSIQNNISGYK